MRTSVGKIKVVFDDFNRTPAEVSAYPWERHDLHEVIKKVLPGLILRHDIAGSVNHLKANQVDPIGYRHDVRGQ